MLSMALTSSQQPWLRYHPSRKHIPASHTWRTSKASANRNQSPTSNGMKIQDEQRIGNLAFLGDSLWALFVRNHHLSPPKHISKYHESANKHVTAEQQAHYHDALVASGQLREPELQLLARAAGMGGLTYRQRFKGPQHQLQYRKATALEALVGHLYIEDAARLEQVMALCLRLMDGQQIGGQGEAGADTPMSP